MMMETTTSLTLGEAARATGQSKPTILRAIQKGTISAAKAESGNWSIEPSELFRVYQPKPLHNEEQTTGDETLDNPAEPPETGAVIVLLREQLADMRADRDYERERAAEARREAVEAREERARLVGTIEKQAEQVRLLMDHRKEEPAPEPKRRRWWQFG